MMRVLVFNPNLPHGLRHVCYTKPKDQIYKPGIEQLGSSEKVKSVPIAQVTSLLPSLIASE